MIWRDVWNTALDDPRSWNGKVANFHNEVFPCSCNFNFRLFRYGLLIILSRNELANYFSFSLPQIDPIFSSRPLDQTSSWIQITSVWLGQARQDPIFRTDHWKRPALPDQTISAQLLSTDHPARPAEFNSELDFSTVHPASTVTMPFSASYHG